MLVKCETKSSRIKGLSFHPKLPWLLTALHSGVIQLWDYNIQGLIDEFEEHDGPVRSVDFHISQPLFVSGGDDYKIKLWNYKQKRCIFTLLGHLDYIRSTRFHQEYPWILSASDDQTVRIWNWQNRSCIAVLAGHNHYVMSAYFHPTEHLLISASLDQTIRIWDIAGLAKKAGFNSSQSMSATLSSTTILQSQNIEMFASSDTSCKFVLDGHDRGVNCAVLHPTLPLVASASDDRTVKLWRYSESKWWEIDTFRGHLNNVSAVLFHPTRELLLSNSEDRTLRVWDIPKRILVHTFRRDDDRFWTIAALPNSNLMAVGHDSGAVVFKLNRERPASCVYKNYIIYIKDRVVTAHNMDNGKTDLLMTCQRAANALSSPPRCLTVNPLNSDEINLLIHKDPECKKFIFYRAEKLQALAESPQSKMTPKQEPGEFIAFVARNRFVVLEPSSKLIFYDLNCVMGKHLELPVQTKSIFFAGLNQVLLCNEDELYLFNLSSCKVVHRLTCHGAVRHVVWSPDLKQAAIMCEKSILLTDDRLEAVCSVAENSKIKSVVWDSKEAVIYSTLFHVKYCLINGDSGILQHIPTPLYLMKTDHQTLWAIDRRSQEVVTLSVACPEYLAKLALLHKDFHQLSYLIQNNRVRGNSIVRYLRDKGYPQLAYHFVTDPQAQFEIALEDARLTEATELALSLNDPKNWERLAIAAAWAGKFSIMEAAYKKTKQFNKLSFLYFLSGRLGDLQKMVSISELTKDAQGKYYNVLLLGDIEERIRILIEAGLYSLAIATAKTYNLSETATALEDNFQISHFVPLESRTLLEPLRPIAPLDIRANADWPTKPIHQAPLEKIMLESKAASPLPSQKASPLPKKGVYPAFDESSDFADATSERDSSEISQNDHLQNGWGDLQDDADLPSATESPVLDDVAIHDKCLFLGPDLASIWGTDSQDVVTLICQGAYETALQHLKTHLGVMNAAPLQVAFEKIIATSQVSIPLLPFFPPKQIHLLASGSLLEPSGPRRLFTLAKLSAQEKAAHKIFQAGDFPKAMIAYRELLYSYIFIKVDAEDEIPKASQRFQRIIRYCQAMRIELERQQCESTDPRRSVELAAYLGTVPLLPAHYILTLRRAMSVAWKAANYITAATFARLLIQEAGQLQATGDIVTKAKGILKSSEQAGTEKFAIDFDPSESQTAICYNSLKVIPPGTKTVKCPFCLVTAHLEYSNQLCSICHISQLGVKAFGLQFKVAPH